jgi:hypothetical protein
MFITKQQDFFSPLWECQNFWRVSVAWAHPPRFRNVLEKTISAFARRRMRGFVCGPDWSGWLTFARQQPGYRGEQNIGGRGSRVIYRNELSGYRSVPGSRCAFDTVIVYFDCRVCH